VKISASALAMLPTCSAVVPVLSSPTRSLASDAKSIAAARHYYDWRHDGPRGARYAECDQLPPVNAGVRSSQIIRLSVASAGLLDFSPLVLLPLHGAGSETARPHNGNFSSHRS